MIDDCTNEKIFVKKTIWLDTLYYKNTHDIKILLNATFVQPQVGTDYVSQQNQNFREFETELHF